MKIYAATSWRNPHHEKIVALLREEHRVYDFRHPSVDGPIGAPEEGFSWREIDPNWKNWTREQYREALKHAVSQQGYRSDSQAMIWADACVITLPCGRSAHLEAGWMMGRGKPTAVYLPELMGPCLSCKGHGGYDTFDHELSGRWTTCTSCGGTRLGPQWNFEPELMYLLGDSSAAHIVTNDDELRAWLKHAATMVELKHGTRSKVKRNVALGIMQALSKVSGVDMINEPARHSEAYKTVCAWLREYDLNG
jgi:hypothetical protein